MRVFIAFIAMLLVANSAIAQDILVKHNGEKIKVKVLKITKKKVEYVRYGTELPVYSLPISDIEYIEYPMGDRDTFGKKAPDAPKAQEPEKWHGPVPSPDGSLSKEYVIQESNPQTEPKRPKMWHGAVAPHNGEQNLTLEPKSSATDGKVQYSIGDIYDKNGVKGVVVMLYEGGNHGVVMSLDEACLAWSTVDRKLMKKHATGANDRFDGEKNMKAIERYIATQGLSWSDFPAFEWCRAKGEGWYLPSINELWSAGTMYMGGSRTASNRRLRKNFNENVIGAGGTPLSNIMIYHSSTEDKDTRCSLFSHMNSEPPYIQSGYKADDLFVRAFYKF